MHWFDRMSQQAADSPHRATRRSVLKGATLATLTLPFLPDAVSRASGAGAAGGTIEKPPGYKPLESINEFCNNCLGRAYNLHNQVLKGCGPAAGGAKRLEKPKVPGKKPASKKTTPSKAAKQLACQANVMKSLNKELEGCRLHFCEGDSEPPAPAPPGATEPSAPTCPSGTTLCSQTLCCYGGDACCICGQTGDFICCAGVIGCTCC